MTKAQEMALEKFKTVVQRHNVMQEIKNFEVSDCGDYISVTAITGMEGDEGEYFLEMLRDKVMVFIGKRGAITYPVIKDGKQYKRKYDSYYKLIGDQLYMWD